MTPTSRLATSETAARTQLKTMLHGAQKARSIGFETAGDDELAHQILTFTQPLLFGELSILPTLASRLDDPTPLTPLEYRNFLTIALQLCPSIALATLNYGGDHFPLASDLESPLAAFWAD